MTADDLIKAARLLRRSWHPAAYANDMDNEALEIKQGERQHPEYGTSRVAERVLRETP